MIAKTMVEAKELYRDLPIGGRSLHILNGINLTISTGEWVALTGPSGAGKSTLLGILAGIDRPTSGQVWLGEEEISLLSESQLASRRNKSVGIVFQAFNLVPSLTALENVEIPLYIHPEWRKAEKMATDMLKMVGLQDRLDHFPHQLSGGEQQRVAIARALVTNPLVLFADEPTGNLDSATTRQVLHILQYLRTGMNLTIVMVTHDPNVAAYADRQLKVMDGQILEPEITGAAAQVIGGRA